VQAAACGGALWWSNITPGVSTPCLLFWMALYGFQHFTIHFWHYCGPLLHEFHHQHSFPIPETVAISILADIHLNFFFPCLVKSLRIHCFDCTWVSTFTNGHRFHHLLNVQCDWESHCHLHGNTLKMSKPKPFSTFCAHPWAFSEPVLQKICDHIA
jgi:hypothetical protein